MSRNPHSPTISPPRGQNFGAYIYAKDTYNRHFDFLPYLVPMNMVCKTYNLYQEKNTSEAKNILEAKNCMKEHFLEKFIK